MSKSTGNINLAFPIMHIPGCFSTHFEYFINLENVDYFCCFFHLLRIDVMRMVASCNNTKKEKHLQFAYRLFRRGTRVSFITKD